MLKLKILMSWVYSIISGEREQEQGK